MQATYDFWQYVVKDTYKSSLEGFLRLFDVLYKYHIGLGEDDSLKGFKNTLEDLVLTEVIEQIDKDAEIWKMIESRIE